jgi:xylulokinase
MGHGIKQHVDMFTDIGAPPHTIQAVGGGTKNPVWLQGVSDISGVPQQVAPLTVGASYGDAFLAALALGWVSGPEAIRQWQGTGSVITPNADLADTYAPLHEAYTGLYQATKDQMHKLHELGY